MQAEISALGHVHGIDRSALLQAVDDAQQQLRAADIDQRHLIAADLQHQREEEQSTEAARSTGGAAPATDDPFVEAAQRLRTPHQLPLRRHLPHRQVSPAAPPLPPPLSLSYLSSPSSLLSSSSSPSPSPFDAAELAEWEEAEELIDDLFHQAETLLANQDASRADIADAMQLMHQAAALGCSEAHNELGMAYLYGDLLPRNLTLAHHHFVEAADDGNSDAQHSLAFLYALHLAPHLPSLGPRPPPPPSPSPSCTTTCPRPPVTWARS